MHFANRLEKAEMGQSRKRRRNKKSRNSSRSNDAKGSTRQLQYDAWKETMPQWLKDANTAVEHGQLEEAARLLEEESVQKVLEEQPDSSKIFMMYKVALLVCQIGQVQRAEDLYHDILEISAHPAIYSELATICQHSGRLNEAVHYLGVALEKAPNEPMLWGNLGTTLMRLGQTEKSIELLRNTVKKRPDNNQAHSNLLLYMHYLPDVKRSSIFEESRRWANANLPARMAKTTHNNDPDPDRRLKIGYISPDFHEHSVTYFFEPLLDAHNRRNVEVYGYGNVMHYDDTTDRLKRKFDHYHNIRPLDDKEAAALIERDGVDILIDLAGHSGNSRIYAMAYKPAPIQVTWLGYPDTTGMSQIDYRLTDCIADPPGSQQFYTEELFCLPEGFLCYGPGEAMPPIADSPVQKKGSITFGSFNSSSKINPVIIELWSRILKSTPDSSLLLKFRSGGDDEIRDMFLRRFEKFGISPDRIATCGWVVSPGHLELYNQVDIALDTYPYNGTTTTCQALLMGVPVISLAGEHHMSRVGLSILTRLGLEFFAASTPDEYVAKTAALAANPDALAKIRASMRTRMAVSPLCNKDKFAENIEQAYRKMWRRWCADQHSSKSEKELVVSK